MRIGEIAALVGVTSRAVRHYHHIGLLPEPARQANGYRAYTVRDAVLLARIRRLTEIGLSLEEVRDVLADDAGRELTEVLGELDADLARQERELHERRRVLAALLEAPLTPDGPLSPALAALLEQAPATASPAAAKDREHLALLDAAAGGAGAEVYAALRPLAEDPGVLTLYERLDELAGAGPDDPRVAPLAAELVAAVPDGVLAVIPDGEPSPTGFGRVLLDDYPPAQREVVRRVMAALAERVRTRAGGGTP
ncbi:MULTISPECIES: MerR family transcriptional regulator [Streptomyces]|uniref:MerR-family transcriptional regulator n=1 Tax=Streptomyces griseus subsp. griseus (strain JCM 4626 / CBS 651.72 / NBRC 13350 / KCC S-0626 / ISP 5235) TaxID=455632 RepID=B1VZC3_STRGG|nr:MerR family transcriptional regulator [Streptomyces griseus]MBW3707726.1 MerR family transcriptional regulator [Streptomyces griseus]BAG22048.1 putative MerR-family transcriptional regulator [Streptomyces griseus subsp. griseus NBRC 13350]SEE58239.1 DNA-binding transcriptional regulator, MerR family [Streptomyces griseus]SQA26093.1 MerR family transcriptional regulator [Streptomyces griseus]